MARKARHPVVKPRKYTAAWQYLDDQFAKNQPASYVDFHPTGPKISRDAFYKAIAGWRRSKRGDPEALEWLDGVRLLKGTIAEAVRQYLDKKFARNKPGMSTDFHKKHKTITTSTFNLGALSWKRMHAKDPTAMKWYREVRLGRLDREETRRRGIPTYRKLVNEFLEGRYANNETAKSEEFFSLHPRLPQPPFYSDVYKWRDKHAGDPAAIKWFNEVRMGQLSAPEAARRGIPTQADLVRQYNDEQFAKNAPAKYADFHCLYPDVEEKSFYNTSFLWRNEYADDPTALEWFNNTRTGGPSQRDLVVDFHDQQFAKNEPVEWTVFKKLYPHISEGTLAKGASKWKKIHAYDSAAMFWYDNVRLREYLILVQQFHDKQFAKHAKAIPSEFNAQYCKVSDDTFWTGAHRWKDHHASDPQAMLWFKYPRLGRLEQKGAAWRYFDWKFTANELVSWLEAHSFQPSLQFYAYKSIWDEWLQKHGDDPRLQDWITSTMQLRPRATKMGLIFEDHVIATLYPLLKERDIQLHYNTAGIAELGKNPKNRYKKVKRVEMRLFSRDLLAPASGIGPALRKFLQESNRPHVAIDITLGEIYGFKITKYADSATNLLVVNPRGNRGQRQLESHVRVLSFKEFLGSKWLNVDPTTRDTLVGVLKDSYAALRGGPKSATWKQLEKAAYDMWARVKANIKTDGSQATYLARVADNVAQQLRQGNVPVELTAYAKTARTAGHIMHADRIEELTKALAALARVTRCEQLPDQPPKCEHPQRDSLAEGNREKGSASGPEVDAREFASTLQQAGETDPARIEKKIDPNRLAEAREFAKAIQEARETEGRREAVNATNNDNQRAGKGFDPARLAEAREFAKAIQEARDTGAAREKKGIDPTRLAEAREYAKELQAAREADSVRVDKQPCPDAKAKDLSHRTQEEPRQTPSERPAEPGRDARAFYRD